MSGVGESLNKFEQVSVDDHKMSVVGGGEIGVDALSGIWGA